MTTSRHVSWQTPQRFTTKLGNLHAGSQLQTTALHGECHIYSLIDVPAQRVKIYTAN